MIGWMRKRATFSRLDTTTDNYGNVSAGTWNSLFSGTRYSVELRPLRGRERMEAGALEASFEAEIKVRSDSQTQTLTAADKVTIESVDYQIRAIENHDQKDRYLTLYVQRGVAI